MTVTQPSQNPNKTPADAAWEKEITDAANDLMYQIRNLNSGMTGDSNQILVYATDANGSDMSYEQRALEGYSAVLSYSGDLPTLPVSGLVFTPFSDVAVNTIIYQYYRTNTVQTSAPAANGTYNARTGEWLSTNLWQKTLPAMDNVLTWVSHAVITGSGTAVSYTWSNPVLYYSNRRGTGKIYYQDAQAGTPANPVATNYNFATGVITFTNMSDGATNKWQQSPVTVDITDTTKLMWTCEFVAEQHPGAAAATVTFTSPANYIAVSSDLESNNYNAGNAGWKIERATGNAEFNNITARGDITAESITSGTLSVDRIGTNALGMTKITTNIQSTNYSSGSSGWRIQQSGAAEFNAPVISRNLVLASFTHQATNFYAQSYSTSVITNVRTFFIETTSVGLGTWGGTSETLMATAQLDYTAEVHYQVSPVNQNSLLMWGTTCDILPLAMDTGYNQSLRLRVRYWTKYCWGITTNGGGSTHNVNIKIYKVT